MSGASGGAHTHRLMPHAPAALTSQLTRDAISIRFHCGPLRPRPPENSRSSATSAATVAAAVMDSAVAGSWPLRTQKVVTAREPTPADRTSCFCGRGGREGGERERGEELVRAARAAGVRIRRRKPAALPMSMGGGRHPSSRPARRRPRGSPYPRAKERVGVPPKRSRSRPGQRRARVGRHSGRIRLARVVSETAAKRKKRKTGAMADGRHPPPDRTGQTRLAPALVACLHTRPHQKKRRSKHDAPP